MIRDWRFVLAAVLASLVSASVSQAQTASPQRGGSASARAELRPSFPSAFASATSIQGVVVDQQGMPLPRVRVRILGPATMVIVTGPNGSFRFSPLPPGEYSVRAYTSGYEAASGRLDLAAGGEPSLRLTLAREGESARFDRMPTRPVELAAGLGGLDTPDSVETGGSAGEVQSGTAAVAVEADERGGHDHGELAWRMRHLKRSPLKDIATGTGLLPTPERGTFEPGALAVVERAIAMSAQMASSIFDVSLSGQVNLLTSGAFDRPEQLFSSNRFARNVAYVSLGSNAGDLGSWAVRGAMTQGDVSSWILAGFLIAPETNRHAYNIGSSYSMQRYHGGNPAALAAVTDGARNAAEVYGFDRWTVSPRLVLGYGARYSHYDYLTGGGWLSPRVSATVTLMDRLRIHALATRRMVAPGAEEFVPTVSAGLWLPPERTFSALVARDGLRVERSDHYQVGIEHDLDRTVLVAFRAYQQNIANQLATLFNVRRATAGPAELGHYFVATAGDVRTRGWAASVSHEIGTIRSTLEYSLTRADWVPGTTADAIARTAASAVRRGTENLVDLTSSVRAEIPQTATRLFVLYRLNSGFASVEELRTGTRFDVQINQSLPFLNFRSAQWEMLLDVRNLFRDPAAEASAYDELLVVRPPKRIVGGILVRF